LLVIATPINVIEEQQVSGALFDKKVQAACW
jgi:hypothetical protein